MLRIEIHETIHCPIEDVFDRIANISEYAHWLPQKGIFVSTRQTTEGPVSVGTRYEDHTTLGTWRGEVIEFERPSKIVFQHRLRWFGIPVMETRPEYAFQDAGGMTSVHHTGEGRLFGPFKLLQKRAQRIAQQERERTVQALKYSLESESEDESSLSSGMSRI